MKRTLVVMPWTSGTVIFACGQQGEVSGDAEGIAGLPGEGEGWTGTQHPPLPPRGSLCAVSGREELEGCPTRHPSTHGRMPQGRAGSDGTRQQDSPALVSLESFRERASLRERGEGAPRGTQKINGRA